MEEYISSMQNIRNFVIKKITEYEKEFETTQNTRRKHEILEMKGLLYIIKLHIEKEVITKILK